MCQVDHIFFVWKLVHNFNQFVNFFLNWKFVINLGNDLISSGFLGYEDMKSHQAIDTNWNKIKIS